MGLDRDGKLSPIKIKIFWCHYFHSCHLPAVSTFHIHYSCHAHWQHNKFELLRETTSLHSLHFSGVLSSPLSLPHLLQIYLHLHNSHLPYMPYMPLPQPPSLRTTSSPSCLYILLYPHMNGYKRRGKFIRSKNKHVSVLLLYRIPPRP